MSRLRAILVLFLVVGNLISALPAVKMKAEDRVDPEFWRADVELWYRWFGPVLPVSGEELRQVVVEGVWAWHEALRLARLPWKPFFDLTNTNQQWGLFAVVAEAPEALVIEVRRDGEWETLYRRLDPAYTWNDDALKYRRIRGVWDSVKDPPKGTYKRLTHWIARTIFKEQPDVDRVRVLLEKRVLTLPWEPVDETHTRRAEKYLRRDKLEDHEDQPDAPEAAE